MRSFGFHVGAAAVAFALLDALANEFDFGAICGAAPKEQTLHAAHHIFVFDTDGDFFAVFSFPCSKGTSAQLFERVRNEHLAKRGTTIKRVRANLFDTEFHTNGVKFAAVFEYTCFDFLDIGRNVHLTKRNTSLKRATRNDRYGGRNNNFAKRYAIAEHLLGEYRQSIIG